MKTEGSWTGATRIDFLLVMSILLALTSNCGKSKKGTEPEVSAEELAGEGWGLFESDDFSDAKAKFGQAIAKDTAYADAYNGRGWCNAFIDLEDEAISDFDAANIKGLSKPDAYAGLAAIYVGDQEFQSANQRQECTFHGPNLPVFTPDQHRLSGSSFDTGASLLRAWGGIS